MLNEMLVDLVDFLKKGESIKNNININVTFALTKANITKTKQRSIVEQNNKIYLYTQCLY